MSKKLKFSVSLGKHSGHTFSYIFLFVESKENRKLQILVNYLKKSLILKVTQTFQCHQFFSMHGCSCFEENAA